jgi:hypothetical protein
VTFQTGHRPAPPEVVARRKGFHLLHQKRSLGSVSLATSYDYSAVVISNDGPGILDQGQTGSCEGHGHAGGITTNFAIKGSPIKLVSPIGIYAVARCIGRKPDASGHLPPLTDDGTESDLAIAGIEEWGVCSADSWGDFPANPATINDEPTMAQLERASDFRLNGAYFLTSDPSSDQYVIDIMTALAAGYTVAFALPASGPEFQGYTGGVLSSLSGPVDHENYLVGCSVPSAGAYSQATVRGVNSWNKGWGEGGFYSLGRLALAQTQDACVLDLSPAAGGVEQ